MKYKIIIVIGLLCMTACTKAPKENLIISCQKEREFQNYVSTSVIGIYGASESNLSKLEIVEEYKVKEIGQNMDILRNQMKTHKNQIQEQYSKTTYIVKEEADTITSDIVIPFSSQNIKEMETDDNYKDSIQKGAFKGAVYKKILIKSGYSCG